MFLVSLKLGFSALGVYSWSKRANWPVGILLLFLLTIHLLLFLHSNSFILNSFLVEVHSQCAHPWEQRPTIQSWRNWSRQNKLTTTLLISDVGKLWHSHWACIPLGPVLEDWGITGSILGCQVHHKMQFYMGGPPMPLEEALWLYDPSADHPGFLDRDFLLGTSNRVPVIPPLQDRK